MINQIKLKAFLTELSQITYKYGLEIGGCGCCGSPWVCSDSDSADELWYDRQEKCYKIKVNTGTRTSPNWETIKSDVNDTKDKFDEVII